MACVVIGDLILDDYKIVTVDRVSPEAPCLVGLHKNEYVSLGGAGNVANNLSQLTDDFLLVGKCDISSYAPILEQYGIGKHKLMQGSHSIKTRFVDYRGKTQLFRYDKECLIPQDYSEDLAEYSNFIDSINFKDFNVCVIVDYRKGMIRTNDVKRLNGCKVNLVSTKHSYPHKVLPKHKYAKRFKTPPVNILVVNDIEYRCIKEVWDYHYIIRTEGDRGTSVFKTVEDAEGIYHDETLIGHIDACKVDVFDVTGAGDTVLSVLAFCLDKYDFSEDILFKACECANKEAAAVVSKPGTSILDIGAERIINFFEGSV